MNARSITTSAQPPAAQPLVTRTDAAWVLTHAGIDAADIGELLDGVTFPALLDDVVARGQQRGITHGTLADRLGGSP